MLREIGGGQEYRAGVRRGTPLIADPGYRLVAAGARAQASPCLPFPEPSALVSALSASGLPTDSFFFGGFLPAKKTQRRKTLEEMKNYPATLVFYEAPHRIMEASERYRGGAGAASGNASARADQDPRRIPRRARLPKCARSSLKRPSMKGEITLMIAKGEAPAADAMPIEAAFDQLLAAGVPRMEAMKTVARERGLVEARGLPEAQRTLTDAGAGRRAGAGQQSAAQKS